MADRSAPAQDALGKLDPSSYAPFDAATVLSAGYVDDCLAFPPFPAEPPVPQPSTAPLPKVPTLLLSGRLDVRTPLENGQAVQAQIPGAQRVTVPGTGHDELDSDITGCTQTALTRFAAGQDVGDPCSGETNEVLPFPRPPTSLAAYAAVPGIDGDRGRVIRATLDTVADARASVLQTLLAGLDPRGGGLRGGSYSLGSDNSYSLRAYSYVTGVAVTGRLVVRSGQLVGRVAVQASGGLSGSLTLTVGGASGTLGGKPVRVTTTSSPSASAARVGGAGSLAERVRGLPLRRALTRRG